MGQATTGAVTGWFGRSEGANSPRPDHNYPRDGIIMAATTDIIRGAAVNQGNSRFRQDDCGLAFTQAFMQAGINTRARVSVAGDPLQEWRSVELTVTELRLA